MEDLASPTPPPATANPASRRAGPEDLLVEDLALMATGRRSGLSSAYRSDYLGHYVDGSGSQNWPIVAVAIRYALEETAARRQLLEVFMPYQTRHWMGSELRSAIYGGMHLYAWGLILKAAIERGDEVIAAFAERWIEMWFAISLLSETTPGGPVLVCGMRCAGHPTVPGDLWAAHLLASVFPSARSTGASTARLKAAGMAPRKSWKGRALPGLLPAFERATQALRRGRYLPEPVPFRAAADLSIRRSEGGLITWLDANANANTGPVALSVWYAGDDTIQSIPEHGGPRTRRWVGVELRQAVVSVEGTFDGQPVSVVLPPGEVRFDWRMERPGPAGQGLKSERIQ